MTLVISTTEVDGYCNAESGSCEIPTRAPENPNGERTGAFIPAAHPLP
ncbi:hypothetical protein [Subtercola endophyticus]|nr:hypothetical protein [Subtercola endophyticus]UFS58180.1 hypothetical protein LQ955_14305 [Subtercola endophyticus]